MAAAAAVAEKFSGAKKKCREVPREPSFHIVFVQQDRFNVSFRMLIGEVAGAERAHHQGARFLAKLESKKSFRYVAVHLFPSTKL